jgi:hypothetical protein
MLLLLLLVGAGAWLLWPRGNNDPAPDDERSETTTSPPRVVRTTAVVARREPLAPTLTPAGDAGASTGGVAAPAPADPDAAGVDALPHPHPITPEHVRFQRENNLIGALNGAMDVKDGAGLRKLLDQYREEFPDDPNQLQAGYEIIADCLAHPGPAATAAGQRFYDQERGSILRRFVSRHCLEP